MSDTSSQPVFPTGFGLANYRSFDESGFLLTNIKKVNVLIGKNNSGKSNVLRAIQLLGQLDGPRVPGSSGSAMTDRHRREKKDLMAVVAAPLHKLLPPKDTIAEHRLASFEAVIGSPVEVAWSLRSGEFVRAPALGRLNVQMLHSLLQMAGRTFNSLQSTADPYLKELGPILVASASKVVRESLARVVVVPVFREVRAADKDEQAKNVFDGRNVIDMLREMQHPVLGEEHKRDVFDKLVRFASDLVGVNDLTLEVPPPRDNRLYVNMHGLRLPLENFGTGVHHLVILCGALAGVAGQVVTIEEPEVHLHPELQRKFIRFIAQETDNTYFLTTHSNVFLDTFPDVSVSHVRWDGRSTKVEAVATTVASRDILTDMGYRASDLLQANGVVWVEGPSDRLYLNRWLSFLAPDLVEGIHYAVAFYGGKVLAHFSCADDPVEDLVQVLRINRHAVVVMDRDGDDETALLNRTKQRIQKELDEGGCWVTRGREIENYLPAGLVQRSLAQQFPAAASLVFEPNDSLDEVLLALKDGPKRYDKVAFARTFCQSMTSEDLDVLDLRERLADLVSRIRRWNQADVPGAEPA